MVNILKKISKSSFKPFILTQFLIFFFNFFFSFRIFITNPHFGNASEEIMNNNFLSIKRKEKICCVENFFFKSRTRNEYLADLYNKKNKYLPVFFKNILSLIFSIEYLIFRIAIFPLRLIFRGTRYYSFLIEFGNIRYIGKEFRTSELNHFNYKIFNILSKNWVFKKIKNERKYLSSKFKINFKKKIILINNRTSYFYKDHSIRNHNFKFFTKTVAWLLRNNFYVILFGENNIKLNNKNLLNYYSLNNKTKIDDILLIKNCDYIICNASGPTDLAFMFNKKIILINHFNLLNPYIMNPESYCLIPKMFINKININHKIEYLVRKTNHSSGLVKKIIYKKLNSSEILYIIKKIFTYKNFRQIKTSRDHTLAYRKSLLNYYQNSNDNFLKKDKYRYIFKIKNINGRILIQK